MNCKYYLYSKKSIGHQFTIHSRSFEVQWHYQKLRLSELSVFCDQGVHLIFEKIASIWRKIPNLLRGVSSEFFYDTIRKKNINFFVKFLHPMWRKENLASSYILLVRSACFNSIWKFFWAGINTPFCCALMGNWKLACINSPKMVKKTTFDAL